MPLFEFDLEDGKKPVSFNLKAADTERFMAFMAECSAADKKRDELQDAINVLHERLDNVVAMNAVPMPADLRVVALSEIVESARDGLAPHISYATV